MLSTAFLMTVLLQAASGQSSQLPTLNVGVRTYRANGQPGGFATLGSDEQGYVGVRSDFCGVNASQQDFERVGDKAVTWRLSTRILERSADVWTVEVQWQRASERGQASPFSPAASRRLTLRTGDHAVLDSVTSPNPGSCNVEARLEAVLEVWPPAGTVRARSGGGRGGGVVVLPTAPRANVEMWLVHTRPDGTDESQRITLGVGPENDLYEFAPVSIDAPSGKVDVVVSGSIHSKAIANGQVSRFGLAIDRRISDESRRVNSGGMAAREIEFATKPGEVVSVVMPPAGSGDADLLAGHRFALRLRVSPVQ